MKFNLKNEPVQDQSAPVTESGYWEEDPDTRISEIPFILKKQRKKKQPEPDPDSEEQIHPTAKLYRDNIPYELKGLEQWVLWGKYPIKGVVNEKAPLYVDPISGNITYASATNPQTWFTAATCHQHLKDSLSSGSENLLGLGFVPNYPETPYVVIDIDNCVNVDQEDIGKSDIHPRVREIIEQLNTYTELSPSKTGLRLILKYANDHADAIIPEVTCTKSSTEKRFAFEDTPFDFPDSEKPSVHIEIYLAGHYGRMSGLVLPGYEKISRNDKTLEILWMECGGCDFTEKTTGELKHDPSAGLGTLEPLTEEQVFRKLNKEAKAEKFKRLYYYEGDHSRDSEDDAALASKILFYCGTETDRDLKLCLKILQSSPRWNRPKMQRSGPKHTEYLQKKAVNYVYIKLKEDAEKGKAEVYRAVGTGKRSNNTDTPDKSGQTAIQGNSGEPSKTELPDFSNLEIYYDGKSFKHDCFATDVIKHFHIGLINRQLHIYSGGIYIHDPKNDTIKREIKKIIPHLSKHLMAEVIEDLQTMSPELKPETKPQYIAFSNGVVDVTTLDFFPHTPDMVLTSKIPHNYIDTAITNTAAVELVDYFLNSTANYNKDRRTLLEEVTGILMYPSNKELEKIFIYTGNGRNGKSTLIGFQQYILGRSPKNYEATTPERLAKERFGTSALYHKLAFFADDETNKTYDDKICAMLRNISSGSEITGEFKGCDQFTFEPYCTPIIAANSIPKVSSTSTQATYRRLEDAVINFENNFQDDLSHVTIKRDLENENCAEYMIQLAVKALHNLIKRGFILTRCEADYKMAYKIITDSDTVMAWFEDLEIEKGSKDDCIDWLCNTNRTDVYEHYRAWMIDNEMNLRYQTGKIKVYEKIKVHYRLDDHKRDGVRMFKRK